MILPLTDHTDNDEGCFGLAETNRLVAQDDGSSQWRRVQVIYVERGGHLAEHVTDLGNAFLWEAVPLQAIYASGEEKVGMVREEAERSRHDDYGAKLQQEIKESSTLIADFIQEKEENAERVRNRSVFGANHTKQRNDFPIRRH